MADSSYTKWQISVFSAFIFILVILFLVSDRHYVYGYAMMLMRMVPIIQCIVMVVNYLMLLGIIIMIVFVRMLIVNGLQYIFLIFIGLLL